MSFEPIIDIPSKVLSLVSFIASIMFNNSFRVENHTGWSFEQNLKSGESNDPQTIFIRPS